jgi:hypothetical protein
VELPLKAAVDTAEETPGGLVTWSLRGGTYVPVTTTARRPGLGQLDEERADSITDEGGPPHAPEGVVPSRSW